MTTTPVHRGLAAARLPSALGRAGSVTARLLGVALLVASAVTHFHLAPLYNIGPPITTGQLFIAQGIASCLVALWLLARGSSAAWLVATLLMAASLAAVLASVRLQIPEFGPLPSIYEPVWYPEKVLSAAVEGGLVLLALVRAIVLRLGQRSVRGT